MSSESDSRTTLHGRWLLLARSVWVAIFLLAVGMFIAGIPYFYDDVLTICTEAECIYPEKLLPEDAEALRDLGLSMRFYAGYNTFLVLAMVSVIVAVSSLILWRRSDDWMAMLVSLALLLFGVTFTSTLRALMSANPEWRIPVQFLEVSGQTTLLLLFFLFPDGRFVPRWTRFPAFGWVLLGVATFIYAATRADPIMVGGTSHLFLLVGAPVAAIIGLYGQVYRYRRHSSLTQQRQTKWVVLALAAFMLVSMVGGAVGENSEPGLPRLLVELVGLPLFSLSLAMVPIAVAVSMLRYRLWDIDIIINRTLVYGAITLVLGIAFVGSAALFQLGFVTVAGQQSPIALVGSTLVGGLLFQPVRQRVRRRIDRRFYPEYLVTEDSPTLRNAPIPSSPSFFVGGRYEAKDFLGEGATKRVYVVHDTEAERDVAFALVKTEGMEATDRLRVEREAEVVSNLVVQHH